MALRLFEETAALRDFDPAYAPEVLNRAADIFRMAGTLTFFLSTPGVAEATAGGFPAISAAPGQFLLKDLVLLAASLGSTFRSRE